MPEVFRERGFVFKFYSNDHEPIHIHIIKAESEAAFEVSEIEVKMKFNYGMKNSELKIITTLVKENKVLIIRVWTDLFIHKNNDMITKDDITKIKFTDDAVYVTCKDGKTAALLFKDFPQLVNATEAQRQNYTVSPFGIHWEDLDEDLSFDGFFNYTNEKNEIADFFREFPEISIGKFAERIGISPTMLRHYACGTKVPSPKRKKEIQTTIHNIAKKLADFQLIH